VFEHLKLEYWYVTPVYVLCGSLCLCSLFRMLFVCLCPGRPMHILNRQKEFFTEESLSTIRKSRDLLGGEGRDPGLDSKSEISNEERKDSFEETKMAGAGEDEVNNDEDFNNEEF
jgi:hypothetical protein